MKANKFLCAIALVAFAFLPLSLSAQGVVTAKINSQGDLIIQGDAQNNEIAIFEITNGVRVRGLNGTSINMLGTSEADLPPVTDDVRINLFDGDDRVEVVGMYIPDVLRINTHAGADTVVLNSANVDGDTRVFTDEVGDDGDDVVVAVEFSCGGDFEVETGQGNDTFDANTVGISGDCMLLTGRGVDFVEVFGFGVSGMTNVSLGRGNDSLLASDCFFEDPIFVLMGAGNDYASLYFNNVGDGLIDGGGRATQSDTIDACENTVNDLIIDKFEEMNIDVCD